jgi:hypothetical protein
MDASGLVYRDERWAKIILLYYVCMYMFQNVYTRLYVCMYTSMHAYLYICMYVYFL